MTTNNKLKRSLDGDEHSNNLLSHLMDEFDGADEIDTRNTKKRKVVISPEKPKFEQQQPLQQVQQQQQQPPQIPFSTPKKLDNSNGYFKSFTPFKSRFSISSPINFSNNNNSNNNNNNNYYNNNNNSNNNNFILKGSNRKSIKTQIENTFIPESPFNIKTKSNKIIPLKSLLSQSSNGGSSTTNSKDIEEEQQQQQKTGNGEDEDEEDIDRKYFTENDLKNTKQFLDIESNSSTNNNNHHGNSGLKDGNGILDKAFTIKQQFYYGKPELITLELPQLPVGRQEQDQEQQQEDTQIPFIPIDLSIKSNIQFVSSESFDWCGRSYLTPSISSSTLMMQQKEQANGVDDIGINKENLFIKSLMYYSHPQSMVLPWDIQVPVLMHEEFKHQWMKSRWNQWLDSFDSLYSNFREGQIEYFYLLNALEFTILFISDKLVQGQKVIMNSSSPRLRLLLSKEGIEWQTPFINSQLLDNSNDPSTSKRKTNLNIVKKIVDPAYYQTSLSSSQLVIIGSDNIDKLFKLLKSKLIWSSDLSLRQQSIQQLNNNGIVVPQTPTKSSSSKDNTGIPMNKVMFTPKKSRTMDNVFLSTTDGGGGGDEESTTTTTTEDNFMIHCKDVPQLLSKQQFIGSTIQINKLLSCGPFTKTFETSKTQLEKAFKIEIQGPILPCTSYNLIKLFSTRLNSFQCKQNTIETTYGFNFNNSSNNNNNDEENNNNAININNNNNEKIEKSSKLLERNVIQKVDFINKKFEITPIG